MKQENIVKTPSLNSILDAVSERFAVSQDQIKGDCRVHELVVVRFAFFYAANKLFGYSTPRVGKFLNDRDHTTVINGVKKAKRAREIGEQRRIESFVDDTQSEINWEELGKHNVKNHPVVKMTEARRKWLFGKEDRPYANTKPIKVIRKIARA